MSNLFKTPILFIIFNRPETTQRVFNEIRKAKPTKLFIAADGPRQDKPEDIDNCKKTREIVSKIDWPCEVKTLFQEKNLGCKAGVTAGINWFFDNVEAGIILEDDCLPEESFFPFCELMLEKYRDTPEVMMISGTNFLFGKYSEENSYFFSNLPLIWGWATWKRVWEKYSEPVTLQNQADILSMVKSRYKVKSVANWFAKMIETTIKGEDNDTWDSQFVYTICKNGGLSVTPFKNQISNIGQVGTHIPQMRKKNNFFDLPTKKIDIDTLSKSDVSLEVNWHMDNITSKNLKKYRLGGLKSSLSYFIPKNIKTFLKLLIKKFINSKH